jgi:hypothetical protein
MRTMNPATTTRTTRPGRVPPSPAGLLALLVALVLAVLPTPALAQLHATDVIIRVQAGKLTTSGVEADQSLAPRRLFVGTLNTGGSTSDPGFDSNPAALPPGEGLPANASVGFEFVSAVRVWNGTDFTQVGPQIVRGRFGPLVAFSPASDPVVPAPGFAVSASVDGIYHNHFTWSTFNPGNPPTQTSTAGLYLLSLRLVSPSGAGEPSEPFYFILNRLSTSQLDAAIAWVESNLLATTAPCPADYNRDGFRNLDDLGDFITDFYTEPAIPGGVQPAAPTYPDVAFASVACPDAGDASAPYATDAYRTAGFRVGFSPDGSNACPFSPEQTFPNLDHLSDFITAFYAAECP